MEPLELDILRRAEAYARRHGLTLRDRLGFGKDGIVYSTAQGQAIKVFERADAFEREWAVYRRLAEHGVLAVLGHQVPQLLGADRELRVIGMTIVRPPFLLDFAGAYLDYPPEFSEEVLAQHEEKMAEDFEERWPHVSTLLATLRDRYGIFQLDLNTRNITFDDAGA